MDDHRTMQLERVAFEAMQWAKANNTGADQPSLVFARRFAFLVSERYGGLDPSMLSGLGWRLVPEEPTAKMLYAARHSLNHNDARERLVVAPDEQTEKMLIRWRAMLASAPFPASIDRRS